VGPLSHWGLWMHPCASRHMDDSVHHPSPLSLPSLAVTHRLESMILQSMPCELDMIRLAPVGGCVPDTTTRWLRGRSSLNLTSSDYAGSIGTGASCLGLWRRRADLVSGYFGLQPWIAPQRMATPGRGEAHPCAAHPQGKRDLKRLVEYTVLIR
jgi:hypothetical protein